MPKITDLTVANTVSANDLLVVVKDPSTTPSTKKISVNNFTTSLKTTYNLVTSTTAPANSSSNGTAGTIAFDGGYVYVCVANNTWKRATLNTW